MGPKWDQNGTKMGPNRDQIGQLAQIVVYV